MGLTQTKLHHRILQENWGAICRRLQTEDGKKWVRTKNPCGDYPLHLACYGGHAPPIVIRALVGAFPEALHHENDLGYKPLHLARSNYREGHPFREEVLDYLGAYLVSGREDNDPAVSSDDPPKLLVSGDTVRFGPDNTFVTSTTCVICLERNADHVFVPCGHLCLCGDCAKKLIDGNNSSNISSSNHAHRFCPVGRCAFTSIAEVDMASCTKILQVDPIAA